MKRKYTASKEVRRLARLVIGQPPAVKKQISRLRRKPKHKKVEEDFA